MYISDEAKKRLGSSCKWIRETLQMSLGEVAQAAGISEDTLDQIENGVWLAEEDTYRKILEYTAKVDFDDLVETFEIMDPTEALRVITEKLLKALGQDDTQSD